MFTKTFNLLPMLPTSINRLIAQTLEKVQRKIRENYSGPVLGSCNFYFINLNAWKCFVDIKVGYDL